MVDSLQQIGKLFTVMQEAHSKKPKHGYVSSFAGR